MSEPTIIIYREHVDSFTKELELLEKNFDKIVYPIITDAKEEFLNQSLVKEISRKSLDKYKNKVVFKLSNFPGLEWNVEENRQDAEKQISLEIAFARRTSTQRKFYVCPLPKGKCANLSRILSQPYLYEDIFLIETPMNDWQNWNQLRGTADYPTQMRLALVFPEKIPTEREIQRWLGEPVYCLIIPIDLFFVNVEPHGYLELNEEHQELLNRFIKRGVNTVMLKVAAKKFPFDLKFYQESLYYYMKMGFYKANTKILGLDSLQIPLQPLYENLDSATYELFEQDPAKYKIYQDAIENALLDLIPSKMMDSKTAVLMIVGAGRGPLVRAAINAGKTTKRKVKIFIIEKNPNAIGTLTALKDEIWTESDVTIFPEDMRTFDPPEKADIIISELLGSLGCNELSPECLDGAQRHLKPDGISIPTSYTSYVNPIMSSKMYQSNLKHDRYYLLRDKIQHICDMNFESNYIVFPGSIYHIAPPQPLFTFTHPNKDPLIDNTRYKTLEFTSTLDTVLHGFLGYFDAVLYKNHFISILPATHTRGMFSWNNFYFPLTSPQQIKAGGTIEANFWRCVSQQKVWYEWSVTKPNITHIHNLHGKSFPIYK